MPFTTNKGHSIHWHERGSGSPLLLIMGHRYSSRLWYPAMPALAQQHRVIAFDNRGTGRSDTGQRFDMQDLVDDALAVMDAADVPSAHVYGVSMGGGIALELAMQQPGRVRSLVLGCTMLRTAGQPRRPNWQLALYYLPSPLLRAVFDVLTPGRSSYGSAATVERVALDMDVIRTDPHSKRGLAAQAGAVDRYATSSDAASCMRAPALVLHGDEDRTVPHRAGLELAHILPHARFENIPGAGHNYYVAAPDRANALVLDFLRQRDAACIP